MLDKMIENQIYLAPIQGITDFIFRDLFCRHFHGIDKVFAPFVRFQNDLEIKKSQIIDLLPANNNGKCFVPQVLSNNADEIIYFANYISDLGYSELNWNLGCPFPMLVKRQLGSGLLPFADRIEQILSKVFQMVTIQFSIKMRLGFSDKAESIQVLNVLNKFSLSEIIIHPRLGTQIYKGVVDLEAFTNCLLAS